jgi:hypothetical protein
MSLAQRLEVQPTIQTVKTLETVEINMAREREARASDPRPPKRSRIELPRGEACGLDTRTRNNDEVLLDWGSQAGDDPMDHDYHEFDTGDFNKTGEQSELCRLQDTLQVLSTQSDDTSTNNILQLDSYIAALSPNNICCSCSHECECKPKKTKEWIIDSGALSHFINKMEDFIDYEEFKQMNFVYTANSGAQQIMGKGTVIIVLSTGVVARIHPVNYVPSLSCKLLSLGTFCQGCKACLLMKVSRETSD